MEAAAIPAFDATGDLPPGIYRATLDAIQARFCTGEVRAHWGQVLREVVALVQSTERVEAMSYGQNIRTGFLAGGYAL